MGNTWHAYKHACTQQYSIWDNLGARWSCIRLRSHDRLCWMCLCCYLRHVQLSGEGLPQVCHKIILSENIRRRHNSKSNLHFSQWIGNLKKKKKKSFDCFMRLLSWVKKKKGHGEWYSWLFLWNKSFCDMFMRPVSSWAVVVSRGVLLHVLSSFLTLVWTLSPLM